MAYTAIDNPELYFQTKLYTGTGTSTAFTLDGSEDMQPDMMWFKVRVATESHIMIDAVRGVTKNLHPDANYAESTQTDRVTAIGSDGFTLGADANYGINKSGDAHVAWCWKESATAGFDIVGYTGTGSAKTEAHSLSAVPHLMIVKSRPGAYSWAVYHHKNTSAPEDDRLLLDTTGATDSSDAEWNDTAPTSSVINLGTGNSTNRNTDAYIAYLWSEKQGFSKFGSYASNSNANGPYVNLGFRPAWLMIKCTTAVEAWAIFNNKVEPFNDGVMSQLNASETGSEGTLQILFLSNGFKILEVSGQTNKSGSHTYVYAAFAEAPFVNSNGVPCNAR
jgi:hypothetical protein